MNKVSMERIISIALLYRYMINVENVLISYNNIAAYKSRVEMNLEMMKSNYVDKEINDNELIYYTGIDENDDTYFILKPDNDYFKIINDYILKMPDDLIKSTQNEKNLNIIGLSMENDRMKIKHKTYGLPSDRII